MAKTGIGLVKHAEMALRERWGYVWGTFGQVLTLTVFNQKRSQYPQGVGNYESFIKSNWLNKRSADCIGLIKSYLWWNGGNVKYTPSQDINADMAYNLAKKKGGIASIPEIPGLCVWRRGHIGIYIGNGWVIEAQGTKYGVRKNRLRDRNFTHWLEHPHISYGGVELRKGIKLGDRGEKVKVMQSNLNHFGWKAGVVDGIVGKSTVKAIEDFQRAFGLYIDGIYGDKESKIINDALAKQDKPIISDKEHWAKSDYDELNKFGVDIKETRFDDSITRGETFSLLNQLVKKKMI